MPRDTRDKILDAASRLFADSDSRGASLRAIAREAGVNSALIHYHFGNREGLFEAAVLRALEPIQARRAAMIEEFEAAASPPSAHDLARLFVTPLLPPVKPLVSPVKPLVSPVKPLVSPVKPLVSPVTTGESLGPEDLDESERQERDAIQLRLLARAFSEQRALTQDLTIKHFGDLMMALGNLLGDALPTIPQSIKHQRMRFCVQTALETLSGAENDRVSSEPTLHDQLVNELIDFLAGGLAAPTHNQERS